jgi:hypothetical protein
MVMERENQMYVQQVMNVNRRICAACPGHAWSEMYVISCVQEVGLAVVSSSFCHSPEIWCKVHLSSSGVLPILWLLISCIFLIFGSAPKCAYKIVVAVPTKNRLAFSPPDFEG